MYKGKTFLAAIPARGGSQGIPGKNIAPVCGVPLISYTIRETRLSRYIDCVAVTTDSQEIANVARKEKARVVMRPPHLAADTSTTASALAHLIGAMEQQYDYIVLLQATQPLRKAFHIDEAIEMLADRELPSLVSVTPVSEHPLFMRTMERDGFLSPLLQAASTVRRQDFPPHYIVNGAIYINRASDIKPETSLNDNKYGYKMDRIYHLDIDTPEDLKKFETIIETQNASRLDGGNGRL